MPSWKKLIVSGSDAAIPSVSNTGDFTIDAGGDIVFDADGADIVLKDGGTHFGSIKRVTSDLVIKSETSNKHMLFKGNDGGATITALDLDMENAGTATFNNNIDLPDNGNIRFGASQDMNIVHNGTDTFIDNYTGDLKIRNNTDDKDIIFLSDDGSGGSTAYITLDGSATTVEVAKNLNVSANISGSQIEASGDVIAFGSSDKRLKDNIEPIEDPLGKMDKIGGYTFIWNDKQSTYEGKDVGVIAQEIEEVLPEVVTTRGSGFKAVKYEKIVPLLIESIKELKQEVDEIKQKCDCLNK